MADIVSKQKRSEIMSRIKKTGNRSTELAAIAKLREFRIGGWRRHASIAGTPDLYFPKQRLAVFLHGCFWHGCQRCKLGKMPKSRRSYWVPKIEGNRHRDARVRRALQRAGFFTMWVWEHEIAADRWVHRLAKRLDRIDEDRGA